MPHIPREFRGTSRQRRPASKAPIASRPEETSGYTFESELPVEPEPKNKKKPIVGRNPVNRTSDRSKRAMREKISLARWDVLPDDVLKVMELE